MNSNAKGGEFERGIARKLSRWITAEPLARVLWRTPGSGGLAHHLPPQQAQWVGGDIGVLDHDSAAARCYVLLCHTELKHYRSLEWHRIVTESGGFLIRTWKRTAAIAENNGKLPVVIAKQNYAPEVVVLPYWLLMRLHIPGISVRGMCDICELKELLAIDFHNFIEVASHDYCLISTAQRKRALSEYAAAYRAAHLH